MQETDAQAKASARAEQVPLLVNMPRLSDDNPEKTWSATHAGGDGNYSPKKDRERKRKRKGKGKRTSEQQEKNNNNALLAMLAAGVLLAGAFFAFPARMAFASKEEYEDDEEVYFTINSHNFDDDEFNAYKKYCNEKYDEVSERYECIYDRSYCLPEEVEAGDCIPADPFCSENGYRPPCVIENHICPDFEEGEYCEDVEVDHVNYPETWINWVHEPDGTNIPIGSTSDSTTVIVDFQGVQYRDLAAT
jgi:hypothetical protein